MPENNATTPSALAGFEHDVGGTLETQNGHFEYLAEPGPYGANLAYFANGRPLDDVVYFASDKKLDDYMIHDSFTEKERAAVHEFLKLSESGNGVISSLGSSEVSPRQSASVPVIQPSDTSIIDAAKSEKAASVVNEKAEAALRVLLIARGTDEDKVEATVEHAAETMFTERTHVGTLVNFGPAPYLDNPKNSPSFYVQFTTPEGYEQKIWGKDFSRALKEEGLESGDAFVLAFQHAKHVIVNENETDSAGVPTGRQVSVDAVRNAWNAARVGRLVSESDDIPRAVKIANTVNPANDEPPLGQSLSKDVSSKGTMPGVAPPAEVEVRSVKTKTKSTTKGPALAPGGKINPDADARDQAPRESTSEVVSVQKKPRPSRAKKDAEIKDKSDTIAPGAKESTPTIAGKSTPAVATLVENSPRTQSVDHLTSRVEPKAQGEIANLNESGPTPNATVDKRQTTVDTAAVQSSTVVIPVPDTIIGVPKAIVAKSEPEDSDMADTIIGVSKGGIQPVRGHAQIATASEDAIAQAIKPLPVVAGQPPLATDRVETESADRESPKTLQNGRFVRRENGEYFRVTEGVESTRVALVDETNKIRFVDKQMDAFKAGIELAKDKGWEAILVTGSEKFRREAWHHARMEGLEVIGYEPSEKDLSTLKAAQQNEVKPKGGDFIEKVGANAVLEKKESQEKIAYQVLNGGYSARPAIAESEVVTGKILFETSKHFAQDEGRRVAVIHDKDKFQAKDLTALSERSGAIRVQYDKGHGVVVDAKKIERSLGR